MPIEIRELVIKTNISDTAAPQKNTGMSASDLEKLKQELMNECKKMIQENSKATLER